MDPHLDHAARRSIRYWYDDGLAEIATGLLFLLLAALYATEGLAHLSPSFSALGLPILVLGGMLVFGCLVRVIKQRLTYPRTGYVSYPRKQPARKWLAAVLGGLGSLLLAMFLASGQTAIYPAFAGAAIAIVLWLFGYRSGLVRLAVQGLLGVAAGVITSLAGAEMWLGAAIVFGLTGLASLLCGISVLARYLRTTPLPPETV